VIGHPDYHGSWFGEGEVKIYLDGDKDLPTLVGTGTEDYIGSGWGQGKFVGRYHGCLLADTANDLYSFYRYHIVDPVYFHKDCRITIQQMGNTSLNKVRAMLAKDVKLIPVWVLDAQGRQDILHLKGQAPKHVTLLDMQKIPDINSREFPVGNVNFYRSDDVSATAYFYLSTPQNNLPPLPPLELRLKEMKEKVFNKVK
jgi:hypothetical protein